MIQDASSPLFSREGFLRQSHLPKIRGLCPRLVPMPVTRQAGMNHGQRLPQGVVALMTLRIYGALEKSSTDPAPKMCFPHRLNEWTAIDTPLLSP